MNLGIETSTSVSSVALANEAGVIAQAETRAGRGHVEFLMPAIVELLRANGLRFEDLTSVAVGIGPGLFTGMRVGIATAKAIAQTRGIGLTGVSSLDNLARQAAADERVVCACIDAKRAEVFAAFYRDGVALSPPATFVPADLAARITEPTLFIGDGAALLAETGLAEAGEARDAHPTAAVVCKLALEIPEAGSPALLEPLYVRKSEAEIKWENRGVQPLRPDRIKIAGQRARGR